MKKTFPFADPKHKPERVVAMIKNDIRKYVKRERRKKLPEDADFWDFDCRVGKDADSSAKAHVEELVPAIDKATKEGWTEIYIEILAKPGQRGLRRPKESGSTAVGKNDRDQAN